MRRGGGRKHAGDAGGRPPGADPYRPFLEAGSLRICRNGDGDIVGLAIADPFPAELRPQALLAFGARHTSTLQSLDLGAVADFSEEELDECLGWLGHVSRLAVPHGLSDRMAARVRKLTGLRSLDVSSLPDSGPTPGTWIKPLTWIEHLVLGPAATDADLAAAARLEGLRRLEIVGNQRITDSGFTALAASESLAEVSIWLSAIGPNGLARLALLESLRRLVLEGITVQPEHLEAFAARRLDSLELPASLRDRAGLELLRRVAPGVTSLSLTGWALADDDLALLPGLRSLETLRLTGCDWLSDAGLEHVRSVTSLQSIDLSGCPGISARGIASLRRLSLADLQLPPLHWTDDSLATVVDRCQSPRDELVITNAGVRPETVRRAIE
ncbi:hypothetical protein EBR56_03790, partial [bacterium]|nr:hypothetical protein [bacterium]